MPHHRRRRQLVPWALASSIAVVGLMALGAAAIVASGRTGNVASTADQGAASAEDPFAAPTAPQPVTGSSGPDGLAETATPAPTVAPTDGQTGAPGATATSSAVSVGPSSAPTPDARTVPGAPTAPPSGAVTSPEATATQHASASPPPATNPAASNEPTSSPSTCPTGVVQVAAPVISDRRVDPAWVKSMTAWGLEDRLTPHDRTFNDITWSHGTILNSTTASVTIGGSPGVVGTISNGGQVSARTSLGGKGDLRAGRLVRFSGSTTGWWALENVVSTTLSSLPSATWTDDSFSACDPPRVTSG